MYIFGYLAHPRSLGSLDIDIDLFKIKTNNHQHYHQKSVAGALSLFKERIPRPIKHEAV